MPIYEFHCRSCNDEFETLVRNALSEEPIACPKCGGTDLERILSVCAARASENSGGACRPRSTGFS